LAVPHRYSCHGSAKGSTHSMQAAGGHCSTTVCKAALSSMCTCTHHRRHPLRVAFLCMCLRDAGSPQHSCWKSESWQYPCTQHLVCCAAVMRALQGHDTSRNLTALLTQLGECFGMYSPVRTCVCLACSYLIASSTGRQAQITKTPTNVTSMPVACLHTDSSCADARRVHVVPCLLLLCLFVVCVLPLLCSCRFPLAGVSCPAGRSPLLCVGVWSSGLRLGLALCAALLATPCCSVVQQDGSP
jgi:hypothetical protein